MNDLVRTPGSARQAYLDRVRGLAVLIMIEAHVLDAWTRVADRSHPGFGYAMLVGGFGAPLFLFLAGVVLVLSAESKYRKTDDLSASWSAAQKRGWQIFGLAFLFRFQSFVLSGGQNPVNLLKVDILNVMGPAIALAGVAGSKARTKEGRAILFAAIVTAIAMLTPVVRTTAWLGWLPDPIEWYPLFVYWIHVEMVYGFLSRPLRRSLSFEGALLAYVLFSGFLLALVLLKNRLVSVPSLYLADNKSVI